jgi:hypothetical protein
MLVHFDLLGMSVCTGGDGNNSLARDIVGPAAPAVHWGFCIREWGRALGLSCQCPLDMHRVLVISLCRSFSYFPLNLKSGAMVIGVMPHRSRLLFGGRWWHRQWIHRC